MKLSETIDLRFSNHLSAACYPTCDDMFDVEFKVRMASLLMASYYFNYLPSWILYKYLI